MSKTMGVDRGQTIQFAERTLALLDEAHTTASYKYALLLALIDECQDSAGGERGPRGSVTTRQLAERVAANYWKQVRVHPKKGGMLKQMTGGGRSIPNLIQEFVARHGERRVGTPHRAKRIASEEYEGLLDEIEWILIRWPIPLLQQVGSEPVDLLYRVSWQPGGPPGVRAYQRRLRGGARGVLTGEFDNRLVFVPGVEENLSLLAGLLRPVIRREWSRFVARRNPEAVEDIEEFLFEPNRIHLGKLRDPLDQLQDGRCFYCQEKVGKPVIDHFLPWTRCADDSLANLVVADQRCNGRKSDHLAAVAHLHHWGDRLVRHGSDLEEIAEREVWPYDEGRSRNLTHSVYTGIPSEVPLWLQGRKFEGAEQSEIRKALTAMRRKA